MSKKSPTFQEGESGATGFYGFFFWRKGVKKFALLVDILPVWSYMSRQKILP
jgi:hypothetical protein